MFVDHIWGTFSLGAVVTALVHTTEFNRLSRIGQLGPCYHVFESAVGTRFEHSIGVSYLGRYIGTILKRKYPDKVTDKHIELLSVAGLLHDIGHGPYSHSYDHVATNSHEERSMLILDRMVDKYNLTFKQDDIQIIKRMIEPDDSITCKHWLYSIISNKIDVDRIDYVLRDARYLGQIIQFDRKQAYELLECAIIDDNNRLVFEGCELQKKNFFESRELLYKKYYRTKEVLDVEEKVLQYMLKNNIVKHKLDEFLELDDSIIREGLS